VYYTTFIVTKDPGGDPFHGPPSGKPGQCCRHLERSDL